jgi:hypothetical protein
MIDTMPEQFFSHLPTIDVLLAIVSSLAVFAGIIAVGATLFYRRWTDEREMKMVNTMIANPIAAGKIELLAEQIRAASAEKDFDPTNKEVADRLRDTLRSVDELIRGARVGLTAIQSTVETTPEWHEKPWLPLVASYLDAQSSRFDELERAQKELLARLDSRPSK